MTRTVDAARGGEHDAPRFVLFARDDAEARTFVAKYANAVDSAIRAPFEPNGLWLVRPDGYVGLLAHAGDWDAAGNYLERIGCAPAAFELTHRQDPVGARREPG